MVTKLHYRLTNEEWCRVTSGLTGAQIKVLFYVRTLDPFGDRRLELSVTGVAQALGIRKGTVSKALQVLGNRGLISQELVQAKVRVTPLHQAIAGMFPAGNSVSPKKSTTPTGNQDNPEETPVSYGTSAFPAGNDQTPEASQGIEYSPPHTIHTDHPFSNPHTEAPERLASGVCVDEDESRVGLPQTRLERDIEQDVDSGPTPEESPPEHAQPVWMSKAEELGVRLSDCKLKQAIAAHPNRVEAAVNALAEKAPTVRHPTRFLEKAIWQGWEPERQAPAGAEFSRWFEDAKRNNCAVLGGIRDGKTQWVYTDQGQLRWDDIRYLDWDSLRVLTGAIRTGIDLTQLMTRIDNEIRRLGWAKEQVEAFVQQLFNTRSCRQLADAQLHELLSKLQQQQFAY